MMGREHRVRRGDNNKEIGIGKLRERERISNMKRKRKSKRDK